MEINCRTGVFNATDYLHCPELRISFYSFSPLVFSNEQNHRHPCNFFYWSFGWINHIVYEKKVDQCLRREDCNQVYGIHHIQQKVSIR